MNDTGRSKDPTPYNTLDGSAFWRTAIADRAPLDITDLWKPKWPLSHRAGISTAGSCFAQHVGKALRAHGARWINSEPAPPAMPRDVRTACSYEQFSFRTGNIYTPTQLRQWLSWVSGTEPPGEYWQSNGRYFDPFRPSIEPDGFQSAAELFAARSTTIRALGDAIAQSDIFIFTLGLTESWRNALTGLEYPMCPGTVAGRFDAGIHHFHNSDFPEIKGELETCVELMRALNSKIKILLTVSPVPLTATASGKHVLVATTYSKSLLRAAAGSLAQRDEIDYFPSYEIITSFPYRAMFLEKNMRSVSPQGVAHVMSMFLSHFTGLGNADEVEAAPVEDDCDESVLEYYARS